MAKKKAKKTERRFVVRCPGMNPAENYLSANGRDFGPRERANVYAVRAAADAAAAGAANMIRNECEVEEVTPARRASAAGNKVDFLVIDDPAGILPLPARPELPCSHVAIVEGPYRAGDLAAEIHTRYAGARAPILVAEHERRAEDWERRARAAIQILRDGLKYHEHDGHDMPKRVAREALEALGVPRDKQP